MGEKVRFKLLTKRRQQGGVYASVRKDAGDDPDVTNKAIIGALVKVSSRKQGMRITGGKGVGGENNSGLDLEKPASSLLLRGGFLRQDQGWGGGPDVPRLPP